MPSKVDIWMPLSVGDYLKDTSHLGTIEHGAYLLLLMHYWCKGPLPKDLSKIANICKLSKDAWSIAQGLLDEFFVLNDDGLYHQSRADKEIEKWQGKRQKAQEKAKNAADARWSKDATSITTGNVQAMHGQFPSPSPSPSPIALSTPLPSKEKTKKQKPIARTVSEYDLAGTIPLIDGTDYRISKKDVEEWQKTFRGIDVKEELRKFKAWSKANPDRKKTERGINRAIFSWLDREQNSSRTKNNGGNNATISNGKGDKAVGVLEDFVNDTERSGTAYQNGYIPPSSDRQSDAKTIRGISGRVRPESISSGDEESLLF